MPDIADAFADDLAESIRAGKSVPIKKGENIVAWMVEPRFVEAVKAMGYTNAFEGLELCVRHPEEPGKLE